MEDQAKIKPYRAVIETGDGERITRMFFAESPDEAQEKAQHYANYERHVRCGESLGSATVMVVAEVAGTPRNGRFPISAMNTTGGAEIAAEGT